jgi:hypothetical protein
LAEIAEWIAGQISVSRLHPAAFSKVKQVRQASWNSRQQDFAKLSKASRWPDGWDLFGNIAAAFGTDPSKQLASIPPVARKWRIAYSTPQEGFLARARDILAAPESA